MSRWQIDLLPTLGSLFLYGLSLVLPALHFVYVVPPGETTWQGFELLMTGWLAIFYGQIGWYANPLYYVVFWLTVARLWRATAIVSGVTIAIALNTLLLFAQEIPYSAAGSLMRLKFPHVGFYVWMASFLIPFVWSLRQMHQDKKKPEVVQENL